MSSARSQSISFFSDCTKRRKNVVVLGLLHAHILIPTLLLLLLLTSGTCCIGGSADVDGLAAAAAAAPPPEISALLPPNIDVIDRPMSSDFAILLLVPAAPPLPLGWGVRRLLISTI